MYLRFTILILTLMIISSCSSSVDDSWTESRDALLGTWDGKVTFVKTNLTTNKDTTGTRQTKVRFLNQEDAIVSDVIFIGFENTIDCNWVYQPNPESIVFTPTGQFLFYDTPQSFKVIKKDKNTQIWSGNYFTSIYNQNTNDVTNFKVVETWEMSKK